MRIRSCSMCGNIINANGMKPPQIVNFVLDREDRIATLYYDRVYDSCDLLVCGKCKHKYKVHKKDYYWSIPIPDHIPYVQAEEYLVKLLMGLANDTEKRFAKRN